MAERTREQVATFVTKAATVRGWVANPDDSFREGVEEGLHTNVNRYGYFLCPCRDTYGSRSADRDVICPCVYAQPDIDAYGYCYCGLFLRPDFAESGGEISPIPERRPDEEA